MSSDIPQAAGSPVPESSTAIKKPFPVKLILAIIGIILVLAILWCFRAMILWCLSALGIIAAAGSFCHLAYSLYERYIAKKAKDTRFGSVRGGGIGLAGSIIFMGLIYAMSAMILPEHHMAITYSTNIAEAMNMEVLKQPSNTYTENGFKEYQFGMSLTDFGNKINITNKFDEAKWVDAEANNEAEGRYLHLYFSDNRLIGVTAIYLADNKRYLDTMIDLFGKASTENIQKHIFSNRLDAMWSKGESLTALYFFPKAIAQVYAEWTSSSQQRGHGERTMLHLYERKFIEAMLIEYLTANKDLFELAGKIIAKAEQSQVNISMLPPYPQTTIKNASLVLGNYGITINAGEESAEDKAKAATQPKDVYNYQYVTPADNKLLSYEYINIDGYIDSPKGQTTITLIPSMNPNAKLIPMFREQSNCWMPLLVRCNSILAQIHLPPISGTIMSHNETKNERQGNIPVKNIPYHEWQYTNKWQVEITYTGEVIIRKVPPKKL